MQPCPPHNSSQNRINFVELGDTDQTRRPAQYLHIRISDQLDQPLATGCIGNSDVLRPERTNLLGKQFDLAVSAQGNDRVLLAQILDAEFALPVVA